MVSSKCRKLCVGELNTEIVVQKPMETPDGQGGSLPTAWVEYFRFWAKIEWTGGSEKMQGGKVTAYANAKLEAAWDQRLDESMRIIFNGQTLNVKDVSDWMEKHYIMDITAEKGLGT